MENNKSEGKFEKFLAGKGFYIVLALCVAVIGISAWVIASTPAKSTELEPGMSVENVLPEETPQQTAPVINTDDFTDDETAAEEKSAKNDTEAEPTTWVRPVVGDTVREHSLEVLKYDVTLADWRTHDGVDIAAEQGTVVRAAADGTVESITKDDMYGTTVTIAHNGGLKTVYSNLEDTPTVKEGDTVCAGDVIGSVGISAICEIGEGTHLHFAMSKNGESVNPMDYLPK